MSKELPSCSGCEHEYECVNLVCFYELLEKEKQKIRADAIDEALQIIHNIYTQDLYCMSEMCDRDNQGYDCEDCLYKSIKQNLEQLKQK